MKEFFEALPPISHICNVVYVRPGTGKPNHKARKNHGIVFYPEHGGHIVFSDGNDVECHENSVVYLPKGSDYNVISGFGGCFAINFDTTDDFSVKAFSLRIKSSMRMYSLFEACEKNRSAGAVGFEAKCMSLLYEIIYIMEKEYYAGYYPSTEKNKILPALEYINLHYPDESLDVEKLADMCGMSSAYFRRIFGSLFGCSPVKYINQLKIRRACELILSDTYELCDIPFLSGFHDDCYFRKVFKAYTSMTPGEYVKFHSKK